MARSRSGGHACIDDQLLTVVLLTPVVRVTARMLMPNIGALWALPACNPPHSRSATQR